MAGALTVGFEPHRAVVAGEERQSVVPEIQRLQQAQHPPDAVVHLRHEIAVHARPAGTLVFVQRQPRGMGRRERRIEE